MLRTYYCYTLVLFHQIFVPGRFSNSPLDAGFENAKLNNLGIERNPSSKRKSVSLYYSFYETSFLMLVFNNFFSCTTV